MTLSHQALPKKTIVVRFANDAVSDLHLDVSNVDANIISTSWIRRMCRQLRPREIGNKRLRFIQNGRPLNSHSNLGIGEFKNDDSQKELFIHGILGSELSNEELATEDNLDDNFTRMRTSGTTQAIGFDRLRSVGFSEQEIELLRQQFIATYGDLESLQNQHQGDIRQLEEQWMETGVNDQQGQQFNAVGIANWKSNMDLLVGLIIGALLGVFSILLLKQEGLFSQRQKMSIIAGLLFNIAFGLRNF